MSPVSRLELTLEAAPLKIHLGLIACCTQLCQELEGIHPGFFIQDHHIAVHAGCILQRDAFCLQGDEQPFQAQGPANAGHAFRAAEIWNQVVIPAAGQHRGLGSHLPVLRHDFKHGVSVVVQTADQVVLHLIGDLQAVQDFADCPEILTGFVIEVIGHSRRLLHALFVVIHFAVQDPQRILLIPSLAVGTQLTDIRGKVVLQGCTVGCTAFIVSQGVEQDPDVGQPQAFQDRIGQDHDFSIRIGAFHAQGFHTELVENPQPSLLRPLVPGHGTEVVQLHGQVRIGIQLVFHKTAHHTGRAFRTDGQAGLRSREREGIHLFVHHVAGVVFPLEDIGVFENRRPDFPEVIQVTEILQVLLQGLPGR